MQPQARPNYQLVMNTPRAQSLSPVNGNIPIPVINIIHSAPNKQMMRANVPIVPSQGRPVAGPMSPLSLNVGSPMYSPCMSPNTTYSPAISPAPKDRVLSPYSTPQSLSPAGSYQMYSPNRLLSPTGVMQGFDPYLTNKMQTSPGFALQSSDILLDSNIPLTSTDFWPDSELLQGNSDLLTAFDDVKLV